MRKSDAYDLAIKLAADLVRLASLPNQEAVSWIYSEIRIADFSGHMAEYQRQRFAKRKAAGICRNCPEKRKGTSAYCLLHAREYVAKAKARRAERKRNGLCWGCGLVPSKNACKTCQDRMKVYKANAKLRAERSKGRDENGTANSPDAQRPEPATDHDTGTDT